MNTITVDSEAYVRQKTYEITQNLYIYPIRSTPDLGSDESSVWNSALFP